MKISAIIKKLLAGEEVSEQEKELISKYEEPKPDKSKESALEAKNAELERRVAELEAEKEEAADKDKPEVERLKAEIAKKDAKIAAAEKERDTAREEKAAIERDNRIRAIAGDHKFKNFDYLKYNLTQKGVNLDDNDAVKSHMEALKCETPEFFLADVNKGGAGTGGIQQNTGSDPKFAEAKEKGDIEAMISVAPEIK